jgi:two-component system, OmpR family, sensor kinase
MTWATVTTTTVTTATTTDLDDGAPIAPRRVQRLRSIRVRILLSYVGALAIATAALVLIARGVLFAELESRIDDELTQEAEELAQLVERGVDPQTSESFEGDVRRIFDVHLGQNIPARYEVLITFVEGRPYTRTRSVVDYRLDEDRALVSRWSALQEVDRGRAETAAGRVEYLAVPLRAQGEVRGVFVSAIFRDRAAEQLTTPLLDIVGVGLAVLVVGSVLAWRLAESVLRPVRRVTRAARSINDTDLRRRIEVDTPDEIGELAATFNGMLDRLESSFAMQRRFLDDAGHELRTPLTIARGHLEVLDDDPREREETVALVLDELSRMGRIVNDLLLLAKAEVADFLEREPVDVDALTDELLSKARALGDRDWVLDGRGSGVVLADRQRLTQAVLQLAQNAVQHTGPGDEIALGSTLDERELRLWVWDTGPGIDPAEHERVFERFVRASGTQQREGAGLGLSIVRAIVEAHGGHVELSSRPGAGAVFTLVIPVRDQ